MSFVGQQTKQLTNYLTDRETDRHFDKLHTKYKKKSVKMKEMRASLPQLEKGRRGDYKNYILCVFKGRRSFQGVEKFSASEIHTHTHTKREA